MSKTRRARHAGSWYSDNGKYIPFYLFVLFLRRENGVATQSDTAAIGLLFIIVFMLPKMPNNLGKYDFFF